MRISHKHKFVFFSKPKCASESIRKILNKHSDIRSTDKAPYHHHTIALEMKLFFEKMEWDWDTYYKFISIRNPWDLVVSFFHYAKPDINGIYFWEKKRDGIKREKKTSISFKNWLLSKELKKSWHSLYIDEGTIKRNIWKNDLSMLRLSTFIMDEDQNSLVNSIIKVENLDSDLKEIFNKIGIKYRGIKKTNRSKHDEYINYYNSEMKKIIEKEFEFDIFIGKYSFGK